MASRMFEVIGGGNQRQQDPQQMIQSMRRDYQRFMDGVDRRQDPNAMIDHGIKTGRFTPRQVQLARQLAVQYGPMLVARR